MPKRLSNEKVNNLKQTLTEATSAYDIAKETGVHKSTVSRYFRRLFLNRTINTGINFSKIVLSVFINVQH